MGTYENLKAAYGEWMSAKQVGEALGRTCHVDRNAWPLAGLPAEKKEGTGRKAPVHWAWRTWDIANRIDERREKKETTSRLNKTLCKSCVYRDWISGADRALACAYSAQPGHHTRHWHALHGVENALDSAHCPFYEKGDRKHLPSAEYFPLFGGRSIGDS